MHLSAIGPKFFITIGLMPSGPTPLKEPILLKAALIFLIVNVLSSLFFLTLCYSSVSTSGTLVCPGKNLLSRIAKESSGLLQYSPCSFFNKPRALFLLLFKDLISLETSDGLLILDVNFFHPSSLAFEIAFLHSLLRDL